MNQTYHRKSLNSSLFDNYQHINIEPKPKRSNYIYNAKKPYKQSTLVGMNYPVQQQSHTIFKDYNNFPSLSKCYSSTKMTKSQSSMYYLSKSFISFPKEEHIAAQVDLLKHHRDKSMSTMQSTDERKEITKLTAALKEKKDIIQSLNNTIDMYIKDKAQLTKEMTSVKLQLSDYKMENCRLKNEYASLQASYDKMKGSIKTIEISELLEKDEEGCESYKSEEQSLSGICFTDKVKMEKRMNNNESTLPALDFGNIAGKREPLNIALANMKLIKPNGKNYNDTMPKYNTKANWNNYVGQKIVFGKQIHKSEGNLITSNITSNYLANCKK